MRERAGWPRWWWRAGISGVAALVLIVAACSREREEGERGEEASEAAAQEQHEKAQTQRSEEHTSELQSRGHLVCRLLLEKKKKTVHSRTKHLHKHYKR